MPLVVLDTSVALPATLSPKSHPRKLLVLLAYGALTYRAEHLRLDFDELTALAATEGGEVHGVEAHRRQIDRADRPRTARSGRRRHCPWGAVGRKRQHRMLAVTFRQFTATYFEPRDFPWRTLDGAWLRQAFGRDL